MVSVLRENVPKKLKISTTNTQNSENQLNSNPKSHNFTQNQLKKLSLVSVLRENVPKIAQNFHHKHTKLSKPN